MDARSIIAGLRDGRGLPAPAAAWFARGLASGAVEDAQAGAFAMAVLLRGLDAAGRVALTEAMRDSGVVLDWDLPGPVIDKHSTGGVGDCTSLVLAPALAACGAFVPMISGRGLGHTGGTLDKMEAIPGYRTDPDRATLDRALRAAGCAIVGAGADLAPADRRLYAIRDVTATVESIDLITASILSKKLAEGIEALVLDVKCGSGAFMADMGAAWALAQALVSAANGAGCRTVALITDMDSPLAPTAGNALELRDCVAMLAGQGPARLRSLTCALGGEALALAGLAPDAGTGAARIAATLDDGSAAERFARMVAALGGPADLIGRLDTYLPPAPLRLDVTFPAGFVAAIDTRAIGEAAVHLGAGRLRQSDAIDHRTGLTGLPHVGAQAAPITIHARNATEAEAAAAALRKAIRLSPDPVAPPPLVLERITA